MSAVANRLKDRLDKAIGIEPLRLPVDTDLSLAAFEEAVALLARAAGRWPRACALMVPPEQVFTATRLIKGGCGSSGFNGVPAHIRWPLSVHLRVVLTLGRDEWWVIASNGRRFYSPGA